MFDLPTEEAESCMVFVKKLLLEPIVGMTSAVMFL